VCLVRGHRGEVAEQSGSGRLPFVPMVQPADLWLAHIFCDGGLAHIDAQLQEFTMDSRCAPQRIGLGHRPNQRANLSGNFGSTTLMAALPRPEESKPATVPADDRFRSDDHEGGSPFLPDSREPHPQEAVTYGETDASRTGALQHLQQVARCEDQAAGPLAYAPCVGRP
jgi:hypothetical protein